MSTLIGCGSGIGNAGPEEIGNIFEDIGNFFTEAAPAVLGVVGGAVGTILVPGVGTALGTALGTAAGGGIKKAVKGSGSGSASVSVSVSTGRPVNDVAPTPWAPPPVDPFLPVPGVDNLFTQGDLYKFRQPNQNTPVVIRESGWKLDAYDYLGPQWKKAGMAFSAMPGDRNVVSGESYPPGPPLAPPPAPPATPASNDELQAVLHMLASSPPPSEASGLPVTKIAGVGAAGLLALLLVWRLAK